LTNLRHHPASPGCVRQSCRGLTSAGPQIHQFARGFGSSAPGTDRRGTKVNRHQKQRCCGKEDESGGHDANRHSQRGSLPSGLSPPLPALFRYRQGPKHALNTIGTRPRQCSRNHSQCLLRKSRGAQSPPPIWVSGYGDVKSVFAVAKHKWKLISKELGVMIQFYFSRGKLRGGYVENPKPSTSCKQKGKVGARGGSRTHMRKNPRRILSPQRLPFRHPGRGTTNLSDQNS
jgi:hypothetical protein